MGSYLALSKQLELWKYSKGIRFFPLRPWGNLPSSRCLWRHPCDGSVGQVHEVGGLGAWVSSSALLLHQVDHPEEPTTTPGNDYSQPSTCWRTSLCRGEKL